MSQASHLGPILARLRETYPIGFAIALHIKFTAPAYLFQAYGSDWIDVYTREGMVMHDPTVRWGFGNMGTIRWEDLPVGDEAAAKVMETAAEHGLKYGFTVAVGSPAQRSVASFARDDRAPTDDEIQSATDDVALLHTLTSDGPSLTPDLRDMLKNMSIDLTRN